MGIHTFWTNIFNLVFRILRQTVNWSCW